MLDNHERRAAPFAAQRDALDEAQGNQKDRCPHANLLVGRETPDRERAKRHDRHGDHQHGLAADSIAKVAEDRPADRARDEADRVGRERRQGSAERIDGGKEQGVEDQCRGRAVD